MIGERRCLTWKPVPPAAHGGRRRMPLPRRALIQEVTVVGRPSASIGREIGATFTHGAWKTA